MRSSLFKTVVAVGGSAAVAVVPLAFALAPASAATTEVVLQWKVGSDWGSGFAVDAAIRNSTTATINPWQVSVTWPQTVSSVWNATSTPGAGSTTFKGASWNQDLTPGTTATFGLNANGTTAGQRVPTSCSVAGFTCRITTDLSLTSSPSPTAPSTSSPSPTSTPSSPTPTPTTASPTATSSSNSLKVSVAVSSSWDTGRNEDVTVTNTGTASVTSWKVDLPWGLNVTSIWNAVSSSTAGHVIASNASWNGTLAPGASTTFGFASDSSGTIADPTGCTATTSNGSAGCSTALGATTSPSPTSTTSSPSPTSTSTATASPSPTTTVAPLPVDFKVAPYVDLTAYPTPDLSSFKSATGVSTYSLGFVTSAGGCTPAWGGYSSLTMASTDTQMIAMNTSIANLRATGGDVLISLGGASGSELAQTCTDVTSLKNGYKAVIDKYSLKRIDFDIEGAAQADHAANTRRAQAIASLQSEMTAAGKALTVTFTLPVLTSGLTSDGLGVLNDSVAGGMRIDLVNVMAMDYGGANSAMGQSAIDAATNTAKQLSFLYPSMTDAARLSRVGVTPMIGENDVANETFTLTDANKVGTWARANGVGEIAWWSVNRDKPCPNNGTYVSPSCSGTGNPQWAYSQAFTD